MLRTFNCGIGMIAVVEPREADEVTHVLKREGETVVQLGEVVAAAKGSRASTYSGAARPAWLTTMARKRVAVLISGRGSNMVALIEAAKDPAYPAEIVARGFQRSRLRRGLQRAAAAGIATAVVDHRIRQGPRGLRARAAERA